MANALHALQSAYLGLKEKQGAFLLTGGGFGINPSSDYGSLSIGKAGIRSLYRDTQNIGDLAKRKLLTF